jgi:L-alanine-DL-glutamate epimerase-like enolase superfamily enzyme
MTCWLDYLAGTLGIHLAGTLGWNRYGPADGDEGLRKNVEIHRKWRDAVGPDFPLMIDCVLTA